MAKKKFKIPTFLYRCDDFVIDVADEGEEPELVNPREGQWVRFKRKVPSRLVKLMLRLMALQNAAFDEDAEAQSAMSDLLEKITPLLANVIDSWNWTDIWSDDSEPLPNPPTADDLSDLDMYSELFYLIGALMAQKQSPKEKGSQ